MSSKPTYEELERRCHEAVAANNARLGVLVQVLQHQGSTAQAFLDFALDQAIDLTGSRIGYLYWYDEGRREFVLNTWSKSVMKECTINDPQTRYELDKTGIWGEAVRQRRPIILNDFQADHPLKRGCPAGHAGLHKFLTVPVLSGQRIVAVVGVANKEADYDTTDVLQLTLLMDGVWKTVEQKQGEEELRKTEERRRLALQGADLGTWDWDAVTGAVTFNRRWAEMLGYELSELQPHVRAWEALVHPDDTPGVMQTLKAHLDGRTDSYETEHRMRHKSGRWVWVLDKGRVIERDAQGRALRVCGTHLDITERKQAEAELRVSRRFVRTTMDSLSAHVCVIDADGVILDVNRAWRNFAAANPPVGGNVAEGASYLAVCDAAQGPDAKTAHVFAAGLRSVLAGQREAFDLEYPCHSPGEQRWFIGHVTRFGGATDSRVVVAHENITARKLTESELAESERRLSTLISNLPGVAYRCRLDREWTMLFVSEGVFDLTGYRPVELLANQRLSFADLIHPEDREYVWESIQQALPGSRQFILEYRITTRGGEEKWVWERGRALVGPSGEIDVLEGFITDITERKRSEMALRASRQLIEGIVNTIPARVFWKDRNLVYLGCNQSFASDAGFADPRDILGKDDYQMGWRDQAELYRRDDRQVIERGRPKLLIEEPQTTPQGETITILTSKIPLRDANGEISGVLGAYMDITERKRGEAEFRESEERNRRLIESSTDAIIVRSNEVIQYANPAALKLFGANRIEELAGKPYLELVHPDDRAGTIERVRKLRDEGWTAPPREHRILTLGGQAVDVESTGVLVQHRGEIQIFGIFRDITERRKALQEKTNLETQLRQVQKLEAIGTLAGGIAHDFNNILSVIIGNSELLAIRGEASPPLKEGLEQILTAAQRAKQLISQILTFSRQGEQEKLLVNLKPVVKETLGFLRASLPATIQLRQHIAPDAGVIVADPTQMQQVLMNLCMNAAHAMEAQGGVLKIDLGNVTVTEADGSRDPGAAPGNYLALTVSDTGHGMEPRVQARIFDPYFTTKEPGKGTGLGLSVVHGIVSSHGGAVQVFSEVGKGTTFKVFLPRVEGVEAARPTTTRVLPRGTEKILLVDDEAGLADLGKRMLGLLGYRVEARTSPVAALEVFRADPEEFDAVISDMSMPRLTGLSLAREILAIRPEIPIILCTGFSDQANEEKARSAGIRAFLFKPLVMQDLAAAVREALDGPDGGKPPEQGQL